jgi:hypothetical protein
MKNVALGDGFGLRALDEGARKGGHGSDDRSMAFVGLPWVPLACRL